MNALPAHWRQARLGDVADWGSGGTPKSGDVRYYNGTIPWAVIGDLHDGVVHTTRSTLTQLGIEESSAKLVPPGAVLVAMYGSIGKLGLTVVPLATNQAIAFAIPHNDVDKKYLFHYLRSQRDELSTAGKGATQRNIGQGTLKAWPIVLPPLDEQRRIVDVLEDHLSRLDAASAGVSAASIKAERLLATALWSITHGLSAGASLNLADIADVRLGRQRSPQNHAGPRMRSYLRAANVDWDRLRLGDVNEMHFSEAEEERYRLEPGDILVVEASGSPREVGKSAVFRGEVSDVMFQNTLLRVRCRDAEAGFVQKYLLAEALMGRFLSDARGVGINHLGRARLANMRVDIPDQAAQLRAVDSCGSITSLVIGARAAAESAGRRTNALRRALLAAAFSGKLTGRESDMDRIEEMAG